MDYRNIRDQPPPAEWFAPGRRVTAAEYRAWVEGKAMPKTMRRGKYNANAGPREYLGGLHLNSSLEADCVNLLLFEGYHWWSDKEHNPPRDGKWIAYERRSFTLRKENKRGELVKVERYLPDFEVWTAGTMVIWEAKGQMTQRSKAKLNGMARCYPDIRVEVITRPILEHMKAEALYRARRRGEHVIDVPNWEG